MPTRRVHRHLEIAAAHEATAAPVDNGQRACEVFVGGMTFEALKDKPGRLGQMTYNFRSANILNGNRRIYPLPVMKAAVEAFSVRVANNVVFGELDHPEWDESPEIIKLGEAAIKVTSCTIGDDAMMTVVLDILANDEGSQLMSILAVKGNPGISQRAFAYWRDPTDAERAEYMIPDGVYAVVAESLRLITYDIVSEPGFVDAAGAEVTEHQGAVSMWKTPEELKAGNPALYAAVFEAGKATGLTELKAASEAAVNTAKPSIVAEAIKPLNEKIATLEAERQTAVEALGAVKPVLVKLGLVNEKITDVEVGARLAAAETAARTATTEKAALEAKVAELQKAVDAGAATQKARAALEAVSAQYAGHPAHDHILTALAPRGFATSDEALAEAKKIVDLIESVNPAMKPGTAAAPLKFEGKDILAGLIRNHADPGRGAPGNEGKANPLASAIFASESI